MKVICIGRNYVDHAKELNNPVPSSPLIFMKPQTALLTDNAAFLIPSFSSDVHFETELVLRFGNSFKNCVESEAMDMVDAMSLGIDFTARDLQAHLKKKGHPWEKAKAFDGSAAVGKFVPVSDAVRKGTEEFVMDLNGEERQHGKTSDLIFPIPMLIGYLSTYFTIEKGDLLFTGTPAGVGPVSTGDRLEAWLGTEAKSRHPEHKIFDFEIQ
ncbi:MAG: acylpyruvate hydrolase [Limisphaerales bacterium]|jgi:acylpyruvate hydrolase